MNTSLKSVHFPPLTDLRFKVVISCAAIYRSGERVLVQIFAAKQKESTHNLLPLLLTFRSMQCAKSLYYTQLSAS